MKNSGEITVIGYGNMGRSLVTGMLAHGFSVDQFTVVDPGSEQQQSARQAGINIMAEIDGSIHNSAVIVLAVKPQVIGMVLDKLADVLRGDTPLIISIAAGIRIGMICDRLSTGHPVIRVMPNTPALLQAGVSAMVANSAVAETQRSVATDMMRSVGIALWLDDEDLLDAVTAVSGSGPAYFFLVIELITKLAVEMGLDSETAIQLTGQTALGAARMVRETGVDPAQLRQQVTSPGGTTEQALAVLMDGRLESLLREALDAARQRSVALSKPGN